MTLQMTDPQLLHVESQVIDAHVTWSVAIDAARRSALARARGQAQTRRCTLGFEGGWMRLMAAEISGLGIFGYKEFHLAGDKLVRYCVHVFETSTGRPLGIVDAALVTTLRTAASAAVAVESIVGRGTPVRLGVVGTGSEAQAGVMALNEVLKLDQIQVTSRRAENRDAFVRKVSEGMSAPIAAYGTVTEALKNVDVLYVATNSDGQVVLNKEDVSHVPVIASIGSTLPAQRELCGEILATADRVIVDTLDVLEESGDALEAAAYGLDRGRVELLGDALDRAAVAVAGGDRRTVYKSIGSPEQDIVLAAAILDAGLEGDFGRHINPLSAVKVNL